MVNLTNSDQRHTYNMKSKNRANSLPKTFGGAQKFQCLYYVCLCTNGTELPPSLGSDAYGVPTLTVGNVERKLQKTSFNFENQ